MSKELKAYMGYNREAGACEGAELIFHHTSREACAMFRSQGTIDCDEFIDYAVTKLDNQDWFAHFKAKDEPHIQDDLPTCQHCDTWGHILYYGICQACWDTLEPDKPEGGTDD